MNRITTFVSLTSLALVSFLSGARSTQVINGSHIADWRTDPAWYEGKAEWALYDATRIIYGEPRTYEATIFTNKQHMDPATTTKASDWQRPGNVEVFKHNLSEMIPTENYTYRFLTTAFIRTDNLGLFKLIASTQEDCGATYKDFTTTNDGRVQAVQFSYFPDEGRSTTTYAMGDRFAAHDALSLTLRDFPFSTAKEGDTRTIELLADQTDTHATPLKPARATVRYAGPETLNLPIGEVRAHHLIVTHDEIGGMTESHYWFADDAENMRRIMVRYEGPWGVEYRLKQLDWWAYWDRSNPRPE